LFGKKKPKRQESTYEIFGGATIKKTDDRYEISWKGSHPMSIMVSSMPEIDNNVETKREGDVLRILSLQCKIKIVNEDGDIKAFITHF